MNRPQKARKRYSHGLSFDFTWFHKVGRMEMHSERFTKAVQALLEDDNVVLLGSVAAPRYGHVVPLAEQIKVQRRPLYARVHTHAHKADCTRIRLTLRIRTRSRVSYLWQARADVLTLHLKPSTRAEVTTMAEAELQKLMREFTKESNGSAITNKRKRE